MHSFALFAIFLCFTVMPVLAHENESKGRNQEVGASVPALECPWHDSKAALHIHSLRLSPEQEQVKSKQLIEDATYVERTAWWDKKPTKIVVLPAGRFQLPDQRPEKSRKDEIYGTSSDLVFFLSLQTEIGLLKKIEQSQQNAAESKQTGFLDYIPNRAVSKGMGILINSEVEKMLSSLFFKTLNLEGVKDAWKAIPRPFYPDNHEQLARVVFDSVFSNDNEIGKEESKKQAARLTSDPAAAKALTNALFLAVADKIDKAHPDFTKPNRMKTVLSAFLSGTGDILEFRKELERIRSLNFTTNLPKLLCDLQKKNLPIHVVMSEATGVEMETLIQGLKRLKDANGHPVPFQIH